MFKPLSLCDVSDFFVMCAPSQRDCWPDSRVAVRNTNAAAQFSFARCRVQFRFLSMALEGLIRDATSLDVCFGKRALFRWRDHVHSAF